MIGFLDIPVSNLAEGSVAVDSYLVVEEMESRLLLAMTKEEKLENGFQMAETLAFRFVPLAEMADNLVAHVEIDDNKARALEQLDDSYFVQGYYSRLVIEDTNRTRLSD